MIKSNLYAVGNIGEIEINATEAGKIYCHFTLAVNFGKAGNKSTDWYKCVVWEKTAELMYQFCQKGTKVLVSGELRIKKWEKDGKNGINAELSVRDFEVLEKGKPKEDNPYDE